MMNSVQSPFFSFIEWPVFHVYEIACKDAAVPSLEILMSYYDSVVMTQLKNLDWDINPGGAQERVYHPWDLGQVSKEELENMRELIGMEPVLSKKEFEYIFNKSHFTYMDDLDDTINNEPFTRVW